MCVFVYSEAVKNVAFYTPQKEQVCVWMSVW